jgi:hypothetical protein
MRGHNRQWLDLKNLSKTVAVSDLEYTGLPYTWDNRQERSRNVKVQLDRALDDEKVMQRFGKTSVMHVQTTESEHCALLIDIEKQSLVERRNGERLFR